MSDFKLDLILCKRREEKIQEIDDSLQNLKETDFAKFQEVVRQFKKYLERNEFKLDDLSDKEIAKLKDLLHQEENEDNKALETVLRMKRDVFECHSITDLDVRYLK